ncbi:MAG: 3-hydroxybutyrate dehydrogenase [Robiginitomaculum sp.]|nr:MAG: 3-hydroxybutyrate dehydrogenase [Robiginitomaculum sp.]
MTNLDGKTALVTGSTSGIGLAIAKGLAHAGANVVLNGFGDKNEIEEIRKTLQDCSERTILYSDADMSKPDEISNMIAQTKSAFGTVDILVNNAGIQHVSPIETFPPEKWDAIMAINLTSAFHTTRHCLADMKSAGWGRIVNIASAHSLVASPFKSAYVAAKHGLVGLTKTVALECAENGVTVNAISPGYVLTPLVEKQIPDTAKARGISEESVKKDILLAAQPTKQFVDVDEITQSLLFLCSPAARNITGTNLSIDGGWTAQ